MMRMRDKSLAPLGKVAPQATDEVPIKPLKTNLDAYPMGWQNPYSLQGVGAKRRRVLCVIVWKSDISTHFLPSASPEREKGFSCPMGNSQKIYQSGFMGTSSVACGATFPSGARLICAYPFCFFLSGKGTLQQKGAAPSCRRSTELSGLFVGAQYFGKAEIGAPAGDH